MKDDPSAAADIARTMAVALAAAGASAEDIAETMKARFGLVFCGRQTI